MGMMGGRLRFGGGVELFVGRSYSFLFSCGI